MVVAFCSLAPRRGLELDEADQREQFDGAYDIGGKPNVGADVIPWDYERLRAVLREHPEETFVSRTSL